MKNINKIKAFLKNFISEHQALKKLLIKTFKVCHLYKREYLNSRRPLYEKLYLTNSNSKIIYFDITSMVMADNNAGIQRAMKIMLQLLTQKYNDQFLLVPIYFYRGFCYCSYHYAKTYNNTQLLNLIQSDLYVDNLIPGSIFLRIDINFAISKSLNLSKWFLAQKNNGVFLVQIIHDLIPIVYPEFSEEEYALEFIQELKATSACFDLSIAVSKTIMLEYQEWLISERVFNNMQINWLHWGSDIENYKSHYKNIIEEEEFTLATNEYFLMVSRIEPRKDYNIVIDAFSHLWANGYTKSLIIVGTEVFKTVKLIKKIKSHPLLNKKLFWLNQGVSDSKLTLLYANARAFIMASQVEGFGLGVVEAAKYRKPLILRDIPVFREIAKDNAYYFNANNGHDLANEISKWENLYNKNVHPKSENFNHITWEQSCDNLINIINIHKDSSTLL